MSLALPNGSSRRAADDLAGRIVRVCLAIAGVLIVIAGVLIAPLPGPMGLPIVVVGLMVVLRNSFKARRQFVRFQHAHPKLASPIRRLLRRDPEVLAFVWQQVLRVERLLLPKRMRCVGKCRRAFRKRPGIA